MGKRLTEKELKMMIDYNDKENYLLMPNEIIEILVKDKELNKVKAPHIAVAYIYVFLVTWLYRYAKYGMMELDNVTDKAIKKIMGIAETSSEYTYIFKKGGVLDRLGITATHSFKKAPVEWFPDEDGDYGFPQFAFFEEWDEELRKLWTNGEKLKRRQIKEPLLATGYRNPLNEEDIKKGEETDYNGTFYEGGKEYTHMVGMDAFIKCMTTEGLGINAFYMLSFLRSRYGKNTDVSISLETISAESGIKPSTRDAVLKMLKAYHMLACIPADFCLERGDYKTDASTYCLIEDKTEWNTEPNYTFPKRKVYHVTKHLDYKEPVEEI
ncbi:hypothetical protein [Domibacillus tundrae]|uniref:hypothetical protein n=1 Tax=Domibacillus tundrae TaxID=1587527 RepID=UPI000696EA0B|nr:hypothetical protein [Domibacillus tundrae]